MAEPTAEPGTATDPTPTPAPTSESTPAPKPVDTKQVAEDARSEFLKSLGFDNADDLKGVIDQHNKAVAANQTELEAKSGELDKATGKLAKAESERDNALAQVAALKQGVDDAHLNDALALAKADLAGKVNGVKTIDDALAGVLERSPSFTGVQAQSSTAVAGTNLGGGKATGTTREDILKMTTAEQIAFQSAHPEEFKKLL